VAKNLSAPRQTDVLLANDDDADVRGDLAAKISRIAPGLSADEQDKARYATYEALETLAKDQITKVRGILSEALKDIADAPPDVIKTLAMDTKIKVSGPVLEFSPVLSDHDLLEIIESGPANGGLSAISKRIEVSESISDAIIVTDDVSAIADLLSNDSAQILEATLDDLIERAPDIDLWHAPLVGRPKLPDGAASRLASFLAANLLEVLQERADMDSDALDAVKAVVHQRLGGDGGGIGDAESSSQDFLKMELPLEMVRRLYSARKLDSNVIGKALSAGAEAAVPSYEDAKKMARDEDLDVRRKLATRTDITPEILYFLAEDPEPEIRKIIAANEAAPVQADLMLAKDNDQDVRGGLAVKIASLTAGQDNDDLDKVRDMAREALEILARDQVTRFGKSWPRP